MSSRLELLERLVNKSTLSTQKATHRNVITVGGRVLTNYDDNNEERHQRELEEAIAEAEAEGERQKRQALMKLRKQLDAEKTAALQSQRKHFEEVAERVAKMRDRLEAERIEELTQKMEREKEEALRLQWEEALRQKAKAIKEACDNLTVKLNREHKLDKELSIAESLKKAREGFKRRLAEAIEETTQKCQQLAAEEAARVAELHADEIQRHQIRYQELKDKYNAEHAHRQRVENDFLALQTDYQRFMDYTDGRFHSDYLMSLRRHGMKLAEKRTSDVSDYQEKLIKDIVLPKIAEKS